MIENLSTTKSAQVGEIEVNHSYNHDTILSSLQDSYQSLYDEGEILYMNEEDLDNDRILPKLDPIYFDNILAHYITVKYDDERSTYIVSLTSTLKQVSNEPWDLLAQSTGLQWQREITDRNRTTIDNIWIEWTTHDVTWKLTVGLNVNFFGFVNGKYITLEKDGSICNDIEFIEMYPDDIESISYATPLDDFCTLFDLSYEIDSRNGTISFTSNSFEDLEDSFQTNN